MADLWVTVGFLAFFGIITGLLAVTFLAFTRMDKDVRRARMFIMEKRIQRFLGAFTAAFIALTILICLPFVTSALGGIVPSALSLGLIVLWLGGMGYGTYELFLIVRPPKGTLLRLIKKSNTGRSVLLEKAAILDRSGRDGDAAK
jgi:phosphotransferase system  glucose/maltose/N-acetylglucosamine-specific IIC component